MLVTETVTPAAAEPLTAAEATLRQQLRLDPAETEEDALLEALCATARAQVETLTGLRLITQTVRVVSDHFPGPRALLPVAPVSSIERIRYTDADGQLATLDASAYRLTRLGAASRLAPALGTAWPCLRAGGEVEIDLEVGFGDPADVPADLMQAMRLMVGHLFLHREAVTEGAKIELPLGARAMCAGWKLFA